MNSHFNKQTTIQNTISCYGVGVHSGQKIQVTLRPAPDNVGIVFIRTDVTKVDNVIYASHSNVCDTTLSTSIKNNANICVSTIEHLMAAIWGCGISNLIIELDGSEVPIMDGSSKPFVFMIECSGIKILKSRKKYLKILKDLYIHDNGCEIKATTSNTIHVDLTIDFHTKAIGKQQYTLHDTQNFKTDIADARTFGFLGDIDHLQNRGLAQGASLDNAIAIDHNTILNHEGLRYPDEFVRHKMLDLLGDCFLSGGDGIICNITGYKTSHNLNNQFLRKLLSNPSFYQWI